MAADKVMIEFGVETAGLKSELDKVKSGLNEVEKTAKKTTTAVKSGFGDAKDAVGELSPAMGNAIKGVQGLGSAFKVLLANPIFLALTALVATVTALYKAFTYTDEGANKVKGAFAAVGAAVDVLKQNMFNLAKGFHHIFTLQWGKAINDFKGIGNAMLEAGSAAYAYTQELDRLADAETAHITIAAANALKISDLESKAMERAKYNGTQRKNFLKEANKLIEDEAAWQVAHAKDAFNVEVENAAKRLKVSKDSIYKLLAAKDGERDGLIAHNKEIEKITEADGGEFEKTLQSKNAAVIKQMNIEVDTKRTNLKKISTLLLQDDAENSANKQKADAKTEADEKKHQEELAKIRQQHNDQQLKEQGIHEAYLQALRQKDVNDTKDDLSKKLAALEAAAEKELEAVKKKDKDIQASANTSDEAKKESSFTAAVDIEKINNDLAEKQKALIKEVTDAHAKAEEDKTKKAKEEADKQKEIEKAAKLAALDTLAKASDAYFQMEANKRTQEANDIQQKYNDESAALEDQKTRGVIAEGAYASKKKAIDDKFKADMKAEKIKDFQADKEAAKAKIAIDTALAVLRILATTPDPTGVFTAIQIAAAIAAGGIQLAVVESQPTPAFAKGTKKAPAGLKWVGEEGPELINDAGGYAIINNDDSMKIMEKYNIKTKPSFAANLAQSLTYPDYVGIDAAIQRKAAKNSEAAMQMAITAVLQGTDTRDDLVRLNKSIKANKGVVIENIEQLAEAIKPKQSRSLWN